MSVPSSAPRTTTSSGNRSNRPLEVEPTERMTDPDSALFPVPVVSCPSCHHHLVAIEVAVDDAAQAVWLLRCPMQATAYEWRAI